MIQNKESRERDRCKGVKLAYVLCTGRNNPLWVL